MIIGHRILNMMIVRMLLCNVHHLREFKGIINFENQQWQKT